MNEGVARRIAAWSFVLSGGGAVLWAAVAPAVTVPEAGPPHSSTSSPIASTSYPVDSLARAAIARDVFRPGRRPAVIRYDPQPIAVTVDADQRPKPPLALLGLIGGGEATAVIEGFPGVEGVRVVRVGDVVAGLRVKQIVGDRVTIVGMDTMWVLKVREPWKP
jgi:hypothetical protein